jgi:hypothetical protein
MSKFKRNGQSSRKIKAVYRNLVSTTAPKALKAPNV